MAYHYMWAAAAEQSSVILNIGFVVFTSSLYYLRFILLNLYNGLFAPYPINSKTFCYDGKEYLGWPYDDDDPLASCYNIFGKYKLDSDLSVLALYYAESWDN